jgi:hypothetical protein
VSRIDRVTFEFVDLLPPVLAEGVVYISLEHRTVVHNCASGCGQRVILGLSPAQWSLTFDGETISLNPSIGTGSLPCNSHYWIRNNQVIWARPLTASQTMRSQRADRDALVAHHEPDPIPWWRLSAHWRRRRAG